MSDVASTRQAHRRSIPAIASGPARLPLFLQTRGSVWSSTRVPIAAFTAYGLLIYLLWKANCAPNVGRGASSLSSVLAMIVGLMISFRSSSSSDRWHEGRRIFASLTSSSRTLLTTLALSLPPPKLDRADRIKQQRGVDDLLGLIVAYSYALKNHLRDLDSLEDPEFCALVPPKLLYSFRATPQNRRTDSSREKDTELPEKFDRVLNVVEPNSSGFPTKAGATKLGGPKNMPLLILRQIHSILNDFHTTTAASTGSPGSETTLLETATWATCLGILKDMTEQLSQAERIRDTPIPMALGIHVQQMLVLYCLSIPPQLVEILGLWVVPVSAVVAWTFFGVDSAAAQLADPFGTDANDLPTDRFVRNIHSEYLEIAGHGYTSGSSANDELLTLPSGVGAPAKSAVSSATAASSVKQE